MHSLFLPLNPSGHDTGAGTGAPQIQSIPNKSNLGKKRVVSSRLHLLSLTLSGEEIDCNFIVIARTSTETAARDRDFAGDVFRSATKL